MFSPESWHGHEVETAHLEARLGAAKDHCDSPGCAQDVAWPLTSQNWSWAEGWEADGKGWGLLISPAVYGSFSRVNPMGNRDPARIKK